jgi:acyl-CoA thioesterase
MAPAMPKPFFDLHATHAVQAGFGHGAMRLFSDAGQLMATASQSVIVRRHDRAR